QELTRDAARDGVADRSALAAYIRWGDVERALGRVVEARARYDAALLLARSLARVKPDGVQELSDLAAAHTKIGDVMLLGDAKSAAHDEYEKAVGFWRRVIALDPKDVSARCDLASSLNRLGAADWALNQLDEAAASYQRARDVAQDLREKELGGPKALMS